MINKYKFFSLKIFFFVRNSNKTFIEMLYLYGQLNIAEIFI